MKFAGIALTGLYINLFAIIFFLVSLISGLMNSNMLNWRQWLLLSLSIVSCIFNVVLAIINIIYACKLYKSRGYNSLRKHMKVIKLGAIPYFILNFILYLLLFTLFFAASRGIFIFTPIPFVFIIPIFTTYLTVLFTSSYGIGFAVINHKKGKITTGKLIIHILLQLCFILDVADTIVLLMKYKVEEINEFPIYPGDRSIETRN